ncbi:MAG: hypothetical protein EBR54_02250 [Flavobacteriia bacterium]|nr:hypothetical protein [Flavobacteriia bacterium]
MKRTILLLILVNNFLLLWGQEEAVYLSTKEIKVGQPFMLRYELTYQKPQKFIVRLPDSLFAAKIVHRREDPFGVPFNGLEVLGVSDTTAWNQSVGLWSAELKLVCWDTGTLMLQPIPYWLDGQEKAFSGALITSTLLNEQTGRPLYDIQESYSISNTSKKQGFKPLLWSVSVLSILFLVLWIVRSRILRKQNPPAPLNLRQEALKKLANLKRKGLWLTDEKNHITQLSMLVRWYLSRRFNLNLTGHTRNSLLIHLQNQGMDSSMLAELTQFLERCESVKFAKIHLSHEAHEHLLDWVASFVEGLQENEIHGTND